MVLLVEARRVGGREGQPLLELHTDDAERVERALDGLLDGVEITADEASYTPRPLVIDRVS